MNKVTLTRLAVTGMSVTYARKLEGNKIRHYNVGYAQVMLGLDPAQAIKELIEKEEGPAEFEFTELASPSELGGFATAPVTSVLENEHEIRKALEKVSVKSCLYQELKLTSELTFGQKAFNWIANLVNPISSFINGKIVPLQHKIYKIDANYIWSNEWMNASDEDRVAQELELAVKLEKVTKFAILKLYEAEFIRQIHPCTYLSVCYEEGDEAVAENILREDLRKYYDQGMILGHLSMPAKLALADTIGSGKRVWALFCFVFVDYFKVPGYDPLTCKGAPNHLEGIRTAANEGELVHLPELDHRNKYQIESIDVIPSSYEANRQAVIDQYKASVPYVNEAAEKQRQKIRKLKESK